VRTGAASNWASAARADANNVTIRFHGSFFEQMGGVTVTYPGFTIPGERVQVTDVNGRTYWITVE
jgi:hypothetical protein